MLGLTSLSPPPPPPPPPLAAPKFRHQKLSFFSSSLSTSKSHKIPKNLKLKASNGDTNASPDSKSGDGEREIGSDGGEESKKGRRPVLNVRWGDLLNPDPDNVIAVGLTGVLTWASVQVLGQLFLIAVAILVAALKYSFIAALLIFILITLL